MTSVCNRERVLHGRSEVKLKRKRTVKAVVDKVREDQEGTRQSSSEPKMLNRKVDVFPVRWHGVCKFSNEVGLACLALHLGKPV